MTRAEQDIEKYRKGDFTVVLVGPDGKPLRNAEVCIELTRHQFNFGTNLFGISKYPDGNAFKRVALQTIKDIFNQVVVCDYWHNNRFKPGDKQPFLDIEWAQVNGLRTRLHAVLYELNANTFVRRPYTTEEFWEMIEERLKYVGKHYNGIVPEFDVINEMISKYAWERHDSETAFWNLFPNFPEFRDPDTAVKVFEMARKHIPDGRLVGLEAQIPSVNNKVWAEIIEFWKDLLARGADIDVIGTQCHFFDMGVPFQEGSAKYGKDTFTMAGISAGLDMMESIGKPVVVTEFTGPSRNGEPYSKSLQEKIWTMTDAENSAWQINFYKLVFSKPFIQGLTRWNHIDGGSGRAIDGGILTPEGVKHQIYYDLKKLIKETWHTRVEIRSNSKGRLSFRGFYGDYEVRVPGYATAEAVFNDNGDRVVEIVLRK